MESISRLEMGKIFPRLFLEQLYGILCENFVIAVQEGRRNMSDVTE